MSYTSMKRGMRWARRPAKTERVTTGLGYVYAVLRFFNATRLTKLLMRKPWHVADLYADGAFVRPVYVGSKTNLVKERMKQMDLLNKQAEERARGARIGETPDVAVPAAAQRRSSGVTDARRHHNASRKP